MVKKKRASKRTTLKDKYKVQRKVKEHDRKQRKEARERVRAGKPAMKTKELGLPNLMPFKEKFMQQIRDEKDQEKAYEKKQIMGLHAKRQGWEEDTGMEDEEVGSKRKRGGDLSEDQLVNSEKRVKEFEARQEEAENDNEVKVGKKKRQYMKELRNVVDAADVILLVVDARDPMGCRAPQAEQMVIESARTKRLIIVLNKIDLVPKAVAENWLTELRKEFPAVAFRASTQQQRSNLGRASKDSIALGTSDTSSSGNLGSSICVGADTLLQLLKNYSRNKGIKNSITVGVVGYPNVGKSSVINSLKRSRAVGVSPTPGFTKTLQYVQLDKKVQLIDSPGVLFQDSTQGMDSKRLVLRNCLSPAALEDPLSPVEDLLAITEHEQLMVLYKLPRFDTVTSFLLLIAQKRGKLSKRGVPDLKAAARIVLQDFNEGRIPYYVAPPTKSDTSVTSKIVTEWAKEFDLDALMGKEDSDLVEHMDEADFIVVDNN